ncbi:MAG: hypothetical protein MRJ65_14055 [Candidatus Brocadiaceae bacterium]|nr:hypothetical protein [Candidatus Brocadiaceae bacterium]
MASLNYHKRAKQFYFAPVIDGKKLTIYLGKDVQQAKIAYQKYVAQVKRHKKKGNKKDGSKKTAQEKLFDLTGPQEKPKRKPKDKNSRSPKMLFHTHANQYCVYLCINKKRRTIYLGRDKEMAALKYHECMAQYVKDRKVLLKGPCMTFDKLAEL